MSVKRTFMFDAWQPNSASVGGFWRYYDIRLNDLPSIADYVNMFDCYRIRAVKFQFVPKYDSFAGNDKTTSGTTNAWGCNASVIVDPNSTVTPVGVYGKSDYATFSENGNVKMYNGNRPFSVYFRPKVLDTIAGVSANPRVAPWIQTSSPSVAHRGFHIFLSDYNFSATGLANQSYNIFVTVYMQFKAVK